MVPHRFEERIARARRSVCDYNHSLVTTNAHGTTRESLVSSPSMVGGRFTVTRKRGPSNWGHPIASAPALATQFELQVCRLHLTTEMYASSAALRVWCEQNKDRCYVPEWLLAKWRTSVDPHIAA